jgi:cyclopropane fatty-acyl-phospholipid synthase-like methyltransferase
VAWRIDPEEAEMTALLHLASFDGRRVLELGCGDGRLTFKYARDATSVLAVDVDEDAIAEALTSRPADLADRVSLIAVGAAEVEAPLRSFDVALFSSSL